MRLSKVRIQNYRSIIDTGEFEVDNLKTILVGPNEAGKTAILQALQQINPPSGVKKLDPLRDYPRAQYTKISRGDLNPTNVLVAKATFILEESDLEHAPIRIQKNSSVFYTFERYLDNSAIHYILDYPPPKYKEIKTELIQLIAHFDTTIEDGSKTYLDNFNALTKDWEINANLIQYAEALKKWIEEKYSLINKENKKEIESYNNIKENIDYAVELNNFYSYLDKNKPIFILYNNYFRVKPIIHLGNLAKRQASGILDDDTYDYGNSCLLRLLGFEAEELSKLGIANDKDSNDIDVFRKKLDERSYELNAASVELTNKVISIWNPDNNRADASRLRIVADGQYLKVVVEDNMGVEVELDQRSEGFQWLVSFFIVFFAEVGRKHKNTILLLDEPGVSLHALKQREFRKTVSMLSDENQTLYTTHSPFLVGPDELDKVRVVELIERSIGTKVHTTVLSSDSAALLPLQEALGYDLAQSLFANQRNLILEGLTDCWYVEAISKMFEDDGKIYLHEKIALIPASAASKVVYFATFLTSNNLKVAALLDSDNAGDQAAQQDVLVHKLGNKRILRTSDFSVPKIEKAEIEDLFRDTLVNIAKSELNWDITTEISSAGNKPIINIFEMKIGKGFSKYRLAKTFLKWSRDHSIADLTDNEVKGCQNLINAINLALK